MAKLLSFKSRPRIEEEASLWLSRMDRGLEASARAELELWAAADPRHARALADMAALWDDMDLMRELSGLLELPRRGRAPRRRRAWFWVGAGLALPAALAAVVMTLMPRNAISPASDTASPLARATEPARPPGTSSATAPAPMSAQGGGVSADPRPSYQTAVGEQRTETLPDGSLIKLNTATRVAIEYESAERRVEILRGEAHFEVQHDGARPFIVVAGGRRIRAVGTAFNVRLENDGRLAVTVTEGRILVSAPQAGDAAASGTAAAMQKQVDAGQELLANGDDWRVKPLPQEALSSHLAWQRGMLVFDGEPLDAALAEVARYTNVKFLIGDEGIRKLRVGGFYKSGDIDGLVRSLENNLRIVATRLDDGTIVLSSN